MSTETSNISVSPSSISIKKELDNDKEFEENPINELLGWYGYENDSHSRPESTRPTKNNNNYHYNHHGSSDMSKQEEEKKNREARKQRLLKCVAEITPIIRQSMESNSIECSESICNWCKKKISDTSSEFSTAHDGFKYCSESCFAQNRRASFKKAKTCDWCKHIRHTVNYVDFQDGASQLQFCSDKCLNQYKMQLFCKETQAHLDMNPHLKDKGVDKPDALITPELWLKNCRSRSASPSSSLSSRTTPQLSRNDLQSAEKPIITVTNIQKLLDESNHYPPPVNKRKLMKSRKRRARLPVDESCLPISEHQHYNSHATEPIRPPNVNLNNFNPNHGSQPNFNMMPPITVMVPYPVIIPLPIPIPIPVWDIHKAYSEKSNLEKACSSTTTATTNAAPAESEETELESQSITKPKDFPNNNDEMEGEDVVAEERQMIPKLKITRLQTRRITESSRPLRKRKLVNSEYMRVLSSSKNTETTDLRK